MPNNASSDCTPQQLYQEVAAARSTDTLRELGVKIHDLVRLALRTDADIKDIVRLISQLNDAITLRLISIMEENEGISLPEGATYLALGSEGRGEQTLRTDQDSAIVFIDDLSPEKLGDVERFSIRFVAALEEIGVPRCPGNIMADNPRWRHSLTEWKRLLDQWISVPTPEHILDFGTFQDLRPVHGNESLGTQLCDHIRASVHHSPSFFPNLACHAVRFPTPLTMFGRIRVEHWGELRGKVHIKKAGIFAITVGASLLALEAGITGRSTWEKLELLGKHGVLHSGDVKTIEEAFTFLVRVRLQWQLRELAANSKPSNHVDPRAMTDNERHQFRQALKGVNTFLRLMNNRYQLEFISI